MTQRLLHLVATATAHINAYRVSVGQQPDFRPERQGLWFWGVLLNMWEMHLYGRPQPLTPGQYSLCFLDHRSVWWKEDMDRRHRWCEVQGLQRQNFADQPPQATPSLPNNAPVRTFPPRELAPPAVVQWVQSSQALGHHKELLVLNCIYTGLQPMPGW
jgi:hypothetical protein